MSGICGFLSHTDPAEDREAALHRMGGALGTRSSTPLRIQSIAECSLGDRPPTGSTTELQGGQTRDGRFHAVIAGDLLNTAELRQELQGHGLQAGVADVPTLIAYAYATWSGGMLRRLKGAFALAVWDSENGHLMLARDPLGQRSLYYSEVRGRFLFASELRSIASSGALAMTISPEGLNDCITYGSPVAPRTIYGGVFAIRPGECISFQRGQLSRRTYWSFRDVTPTNLSPDSYSREFLPEFRTRFAAVIRSHFSLDARIGCVVTGDMGSTLVTGLAAKVSPTPLRTFSVCYADEDFRSEDYAPRIARHFGTRHDSRLLGATDVARDLDAILASYDQPGDDILSAFYVSQSAAASGITALLAGTGAPALFGHAEWSQSNPPLPSGGSWWQRLLPLGTRGGQAASRMLLSLLRRGGSLHEVAALHQRVVSENQRQRLLSKPGSFRPHDELEHLPREVPDRDVSLVASAWTIRARLSGYVLPSVQRAAATHGLRMLYPMLDPSLLAWCRSHPRDAVRASMSDASGLASTLSDLLLPDMRIRPQIGDQPPYHLWMRGTLRPFMEQTLSELSIAQSGLFHVQPVRQLWHEALAGETTDWAALWRLAVLINFVNRRTTTSIGRHS